MVCTYKPLFCPHMHILMETVMERTVTKQVRLTKDEASRLARLAKRLNMTESDILRSGIAHEEARGEKERRRAAAWEALAKMAEEIPGEDVKFRLK